MDILRELKELIPWMGGDALLIDAAKEIEFLRDELQWIANCAPSTSLGNDELLAFTLGERARKALRIIGHVQIHKNAD